VGGLPQVKIQVRRLKSTRVPAVLAGFAPTSLFWRLLLLRNYSPKHSKFVKEVVIERRLKAIWSFLFTWVCPTYILISTTETRNKDGLRTGPIAGTTRAPNSVLHAGRPVHPALSGPVMAHLQHNFFLRVELYDDGRHPRVWWTL
jgi:hypothetical protein